MGNVDSSFTRPRHQHASAALVVLDANLALNHLIAGSQISGVSVGPCECAKADTEAIAIKRSSSKLHSLEKQPSQALSQQSKQHPWPAPIASDSGGCRMWIRGGWSEMWCWRIWLSQALHSLRMPKTYVYEVDGGPSVLRVFPPRAGD